MKASPFNYHSPTTCDEACGLIASLDNVRPLAGGQSLLPLMHFRYVMPDHLVDLNGIKELSYIRLQNGELNFGAVTRQSEIEFSTNVKQAAPVMVEALKYVGHRQTRNRGTIGGSLSHLDPTAELANVAMLHDAEIQLRGKEGARTVAMRVFAKGFMTTDIRDGEMLAHVVFKTWASGHGYAFEEVAKRRGDFAIAAVGALVELQPTGEIRRSAIAISGITSVPLRLTVAEKALEGQRRSHDLIRMAAIEASKIEAMSDAHVDASYRQHLARILTYRALQRALDRAEEAHRG
jgi:aerobic carbon-monoxide dehydrogenase medium subunit